MRPRSRRRCAGPTADNGTATEPDDAAREDADESSRPSEGDSEQNQLLDNSSSLDFSTALFVPPSEVDHEVRGGGEESLTSRGLLQVLVELYDLNLNNSRRVDGVWEETARWIKYEEDVEGVDHHWGQPHVAFLSFHALIQLRKCIARGTVIKDVDATQFSEVCDVIAEVIAAEGHCALSAERIRQVLLLQHK